MAGPRFPKPNTWRKHACLVVWLAAAPAMAQVCSGPIAVAAPSPSVDGERYGMVVEQCPGLATPLNPHRAAQLDLYDKPTRTITDTPVAAPAAPAKEPGVTQVKAPAKPLAPPTRDAARVIALAPALTEAAKEYDVDPLLLHAVAHIESRHNPAAVSHAGAMGVMQMMPATARRFGVSSSDSLHNPDVNLRASAAYLQQLKARYGDDLRLTLAAYNAGEGAVAKYGGVPPYPETQAYVRNVMAVYRRLSDAFTVSANKQLIARGDK